MAKVNMRADGIGMREFELSHAEAILAFEQKIKAQNWKLVSKNHTFKDGKIIKGASVDEAAGTEEQGTIGNSGAAPGTPDTAL